MSVIELEVNDVCEGCGEPIHVPARAVRCEWGCCVWDEDAVTALGVDLAPLSRPLHQCSLCIAATHRFSPRVLVDRARRGVEPVPPRYELVGGVPVKKRSPEA